MNYLYAALGIAIIAIALPIIFLTSLLWYRTTTVPPSIPWAGLKNKTFLPKIRACFREFTANRAPLEEGYEAYTKHGKPFIAPAFHWPDVILPPSNFAWLLSQPENVLSANKVQEEHLALKYLSHGPDLAALMDFTVVRQDLTRNLQRVLPGVLNEIEDCLSTTELKDLPLPSIISSQSEAEWKSVPIFQIIWATSRRFNHRVFVGLPLCRDERYITRLRAWETIFGVCVAVIKCLIPSFLKPWLAPIAAIPARVQAWRLKKLVLPVMHERIAAQTQTGDSKVNEAEKPDDVLQWLMDDKHAKSRSASSRALTLDEIAGRTIELNFFSVATIAMGTCSILADILTYTSAATLISALRAEAEIVLPKLHSDPRAIRDMEKLDSVIRESLRLNRFGAKALGREVIPHEGVITPDGVFLPQGTHVAMLASNRQRDHDVWERADEFVPLRFVKSDDNGAESEVGKTAVHVTEDFLAFGYGRHACPGRFFAVQAMKVLIGYLLVNYDFEPLSEPPKMIEVGEAIVPDDNTKMNVRRRWREKDLLV